jgi:predicted RNA-binding Zn ribbon-like protein
VFLDESRGKRRRWCDMNDCGSRAKARRYYHRQKRV